VTIEKMLRKMEVEEGELSAEKGYINY